MRNRRRAIAAETMAILDRGGYRHPAAGNVALADEIARAVAGTRAYPPGAPLPSPPPGGSPRLEVTAETTLAAARRLPPARRAWSSRRPRVPAAGS